MIDFSLLHILIIEDEALIARNIQLNLNIKGVKTSKIVDNSDAAFLEIDHDTPDIILMDFYIKGSLNGAQIAKKIREKGLSIPIIFMTAYSDSDTIGELNLFSPCSIMSKPFQFNMLFDKIKSLLSDYPPQP